MSRVPLRSHEDLPPEDRELVWRRGNLYKTLVHSPELAARVAAFGYWINCASQIDKRMQELVILHVAHLLGSKFEWTAHVRSSIQNQTLTPEEIEAVKREAKGERADELSQLESDALQLVRQIVRNRKADDDCYAAVRARFSDAYMVEFASLVGMYVGLAHLIEVIEIDIQPDYLPWLEKYPIN